MRRDGNHAPACLLSASAIALLAGTAVLAPISPAVARDTKNLWSLGGSVAFHSTDDTVRSNADLTGDPRPDDFVSREIAIEDGFGYSLSAAYGLNTWLSLQLDVGYFDGDVGPVEVYLSDGFPVPINPADPVNISRFHLRDTTIPVLAGRLTEIPVGLTGIVRFRKDRPVNPYIGAGFGMIFTDLDQRGDIDDLNGRLSRLRIRAVLDEFGNELTPDAFKSLKGEGRVPLTHPLTVRVDDALEWHLTAGVEFFFRDNLSLVADARYTFADQDLVIDLAGEDQIDFLIWSEELFRPDGSLKLFRNQGGFPNPYIDPLDPGRGTITCPAKTTGDFDRDGHRDDLCYDARIGDPTGTFVVQGGRINLSGFSARLGLRFHF